MTENVPNISGRDIALNLDTVERDEVRPPFVFVLKGREITLNDPADLDWQIMNAIDDEVEYLQQAMTKEDLEFFLGEKLPIWKMEKLGRKFQEHYGAEEPGKAGRSSS